MCGLKLNKYESFCLSLLDQFVSVQQSGVYISRNTPTHLSPFYYVMLSLSLRNIWLRVHVVKSIACQTRYFVVNNDIAFCYYEVNSGFNYI